MRFVTDLSKGILGTPDSPVLWQEIISHIPDEVLLKPNVKILNVACGHGTEADILVKRMYALGKRPEEVRNSIYVLDKYHVFTKPMRLKGYKHVINADFLTWEPNMTPDVILMNPPFQNENSEATSGKMWIKFIKKALQILPENGYLACISPNSWTKGEISQQGSGTLLKLLTEQNLIHVNNIDCGSYFPGIGVSFSYFVVQKADGPSKGTLTQNGKTISVDFRRLRMIPKAINAVSIVNKFYGGPTFQHKLNTNVVNHLLDLKDVGTTPVYTNGKIRFTEKTGLDESEKILIPWANDYIKGIRIGKMVAGDSCVYMTADENAETLMTVLTSKLYRFCLDQVRMAHHNEPVRKFPAVDLTRTWTDEELYAHFELTPEEIEYIEKNG